MLKLILRTSTEGTKIALQSIYIEPTKKATITYQLLSITGGISNHDYIMEGEQYALWGTDDTLIYHLLCARHNLQYKPYEEPEFFEEVVVWMDDVSGEVKSKVVKKPNPNYIPPVTQ
jgi:hypothetical protein